MRSVDQPRSRPHTTNIDTSVHERPERMRLPVGPESLVDVHVPPYEEDLSIVITTTEHAEGDG